MKINLYDAIESLGWGGYIELTKRYVREWYAVYGIEVVDED